MAIDRIEIGPYSALLGRQVALQLTRAVVRVQCAQRPPQQRRDTENPSDWKQYPSGNQHRVGISLPLQQPDGHARNGKRSQRNRSGAASHNHPAQAASHLSQVLIKTLQCVHEVRSRCTWR